MATSRTIKANTISNAGPGLVSVSFQEVVEPGQPSTVNFSMTLPREEVEGIFFPDDDSTYTLTITPTKKTPASG